MRRASVVLVVLAVLCGCRTPDIPVGVATVEVTPKGTMVVTPETATFAPKKVEVVSGGTTSTYTPKKALGIPWRDIVGIGTVTLVAAAVVFVWLKSKNGAAIVLALGGSGIAGIVFWEIKWYILCTAILAVAAWVFLPRLKDTLGGDQ